MAYAPFFLILIGATPEPALATPDLAELEQLVVERALGQDQAEVYLDFRASPAYEQGATFVDWKLDAALWSRNWGIAVILSGALFVFPVFLGVLSAINNPNPSDELIAVQAATIAGGLTGILGLEALGIYLLVTGERERVALEPLRAPLAPAEP